jgi:hypothetical protein
VRICSWFSIPNDDFCTPIENWFDEIGDTMSRVLIVPISIDDDISSEHESVHDTVMESYSEASVRFKLNDMMDTEFASYF